MCWKTKVGKHEKEYGISETFRTINGTTSSKDSFTKLFFTESQS